MPINPFTLKADKRYVERLKTITITDAREFFATYLRETMKNQKVEASESSVLYIVDLMIRSMETQHFFSKDETGKLKQHVLVDLLKQALEQDEAGKKIMLQRLGDISLLISGLFSDSISRKIVDLDYYFGMGEAAYSQLAQLQQSKSNRNVFNELSNKFKPFSNVLTEIGHRSGLQSSNDLLKLYEKWIYSGSEEIKKILEEKGIKNPLPIKTKTKH